VNRHINQKNVAMNVIRQLQHKCIICNSEFCDGERCLPPGACFTCGGNHMRSMCDTKWKKVLESKGCYFCLDLFSQQGYTSHDSKTGCCPLQRRLKRLVIQQFQASKERRIDLFYLKNSSNMPNFYAFIASAFPMQTLTPNSSNDTS